MVIYLGKRRKILCKFIILIILFVFIYIGGFLNSYLKYNNKNVVDSNALSIQNQILKKELGDIENLNIDSGNYIIGKVVFRDIYNFYDEVVINLGRDVVEVGDAVVDSCGLVGIVYNTKNNLSYVKLLSSNYNVSVKVNDTYGNLSMGEVSLLNKYSEINVGDIVYTSGYGDVLGNIYVGKVNSIKLDNDGLGKEVKVNYCDNSNLNYVAILRNIS